MKRRIFLGAASLLLFVVFLVALLPARVVVGWLSLPSVGLSGIEGTIWSGSAIQLSVGNTALGSLQWENGSLGLLIGRPAWDIELERPDGFVRGHIGLRASGHVRLQGVDAVGSLGNLEGLLPLYGTQGDVTVRIEQLRVEDNQFALIHGRIVIDKVRTNALKSGDLGTIELSFPGNEAAPLTGLLTTLNGPLQIRDGQVIVSAHGGYQITGRVAPVSDAPQEIVDAMQFFGSADGEGFRQFSQSGNY
ncbi:MAG: type II secretion system protein N [Gammaproteobacteria bacterium]